MPRKPRLHYPGALYHVISRGNNRQTTFLTPNDYQTFLNYLERVQEHRLFLLYAYCLMPNHFHLLLEVKGDPLPQIMQRLLTGYTHYFNRIHQRGGHLFQGRYKSFICEKDTYLLELVRYIHLNPVRANLVRSPGDWKWSGHGVYLGRSSSLVSTDLVLAKMANGLAQARRAYGRFVREGLQMGHRRDLYPEETTPYLGEREFVTENRVRHEELMTHSAPVRGSQVKMPDLLAKMCNEKGIEPTVLAGASRHRPVAALRKEFIRKAHALGHGTTDIARIIARSQPFVAKVIQQN